MTDILTLAQARSALGWPDGAHTEHDTELSTIWIPLVTEVFESSRVVGRLSELKDSYLTRNASPITTPWVSGTVFDVFVNGRQIDEDYWSWSAPTLTISWPLYEAGDEVIIWAYGIPQPVSITAAAMATIKSVWNGQHNGRGTDARPNPLAEAAGNVDPDLLLPPIAWKLTARWRPVGGFA